MFSLGSHYLHRTHSLWFITAYEERVKCILTPECQTGRDDLYWADEWNENSRKTQDNTIKYFLTFFRAHLGLKWPQGEKNDSKVSDRTVGTERTVTWWSSSASARPVWTVYWGSSIWQGERRHWAPLQWNDLPMTLSGPCTVSTFFFFFFFFFYLFQLNCLQCRNVELPLKTHLFLTTLTRHKHTLTYSPFNRLDPYVFAGYDLFVCSDQSCQRCLKTTNRQQVTTAETKALEEAHGAKEIIGRRDCWCVQVWLWGADGA